MKTKSIFLKESNKLNKNLRAALSGIGADEVMAFNDFYSCGWGNVDKFDYNIKEYFPWKNFFYGSMENYLKGEEYIGGAYSWETRYSFCDTKLIQEFLWLKPELKNNFISFQSKHN